MTFVGFLWVPGKFYSRKKLFGQAPHTIHQISTSCLWINVHAIDGIFGLSEDGRETEQVKTVVRKLWSIKWISLSAAMANRWYDFLKSRSITQLKSKRQINFNQSKAININWPPFKIIVVVENMDSVYSIYTAHITSIDAPCARFSPLSQLNVYYTNHVQVFCEQKIPNFEM